MVSILQKLHSKKVLCWLLLFAPMVGIAQKEHQHLSCSHAKTALAHQHKTSDARLEKYDLVFAHLKIKNDPASSFIEGSVDYRIRCLQTLNEVVFELAENMTVDSVLFENQSIGFQHDSLLVITLPQTKQTGEEIELEIIYQGSPESGGLGTFQQNEHNGVPMVWTLSQPYGAKAWWPVKQSLNDKFDSVRISISTPKQYTAVSNGLLVNTKENNAWKTHTFQHGHRIPTYLIAFAITEYAYSTYELPLSLGNLTMENYLFTYMEEELLGEAKKVDGAMRYFDSLFLPYPYMDEKYAHAQFTRGGGMEHTTVSFMGNFHLNLVVHELGHHWFGNYTTCNSWSEIWLNEGFASYCEGLYYEVFEGGAYWQTWLGHTLENATTYDTGSVYVYDTTEVSRVFDSKLSYTKAAYVLHQLRYQIGDVAFFEGLRTYLRDPENAFGFTSTENLKQHLENSSGQDLSAYFDYFIYGEGYPKFTIKWQRTNEGVRGQITQSNSAKNGNLASLKIPLHLVGYEQDTVVHVESSATSHTFQLQTTFRVTEISFDPEHWILTKETEVIKDPRGSTMVVYPIPAKNHVHFTAENKDEFFSQIYIVNGLGQEVFAFESDTADGINYVKVATSQWESGMYFAQIRTADGGLFQRKISIEQ